MLRKSSLWLAAFCTLLAVPVAHAGSWTIGLNGGLCKPTGDVGKDLKMGPAGGLEVGYQLNDKLTIGADGTWNRNKHKDVGVVEDLGGGDTYTLDKDNVNIINGGVHAKYMIPVGEASKISPFGLVGLGMYKVKEDYQETLVLSGTTYVSTDESNGDSGDTRFGGKFGAGAVYKATEQVGISLQGEYNIVTLDTAGAPPDTPSTFKFFGIRAGLNYHIMAK
jgi:opacity protein-like surface antigen